MSTTLYRKYRPQKFSEIIGQRHIVQTLSNAVKYNRLGQAYLFTGPRGTGKTTLARLLAKAINCLKTNDAEPCNQCEICQNISEGKSLDIIEIDAASHTGVDNIRELRETVKLPPTQSKFKVYIIDEAHMLSISSFNALLKTLEEPPAHVIFILATTAIHKIPETIISRCQRFDFGRLDLEQIVAKLADIAKSEKVSVDKEALEMIAVAAEGGMRDAESLLAQIIALEDKNITADEVKEILGTARRESVSKMAVLILEKNAASALDLAHQLSLEGVNFEVFHKSLLNYLRQLMVVSISSDLAQLFKLELTPEELKKIVRQAERFSTKEILSVLEIFIEARQKIRSSFIPSLPLEVAIVKSAGEKQNLDARENKKFENIAKNISRSASNANGETVKEKKLEAKNEDKESRLQVAQVANAALSDSNSPITIEQVKSEWHKIVSTTRRYNHSIMAYLSNCQPARLENNEVIIATRYSLYKGKLNESKNCQIVEKVAAEIIGKNIRFKFLTEEEAGIKIDSVKKENGIAKENGSLLDDALKIMGGKIVE